MSDGLFDKEKIAALTERIVNALRPVGISSNEEAISFQLHDGHLAVVIMGEVREEAAAKSADAIEMTKDFNRTMADNNDAKIAEDLQKIRDMTTSEDALEDALFGQEACEHPNIHPEGFCIDCGETQLDGE